MLEQLSVQNYALIRNVTVDFAPGLTILSGETGAGKSILVGALGLLLGAKAGVESIRSGADEAVASAVLNVSECPEALDWLEERSISAEADGRILLRRSLRRNGRSAAFIQGVPVTAGDLTSLTALLVDLHGQHEHQSLLYQENHRRLTDRFAGIQNEVKAFGDLFSALGKAKGDLQELQRMETHRSHERELLEHAVVEIQQAQLRADEESDLLAEKRRMLDFEKLYAQVNTAAELLAQDSGLAALRKAALACKNAAVIDPALGDRAERLDALYYDLEDLSQQLSVYVAKLSFDPGRLEAIEERLAVLFRLKKKYGTDVGKVLSYADEAVQKLAILDNTEETRKELETRIRTLEQELGKKAAALTAARSAAAKTIQDEISSHLRSLGMKNAVFQVSVTPKITERNTPLCTQYGADDVTFLISANVGETPKPLKQVASGGEVSRVMLAVKTVLSCADSIQTLIFDEIDSGIGGEIALSVGDFLRKLSATRQVLCITHLATIAGKGKHHFRVEKKVENGQTTTDIVKVEREDRVLEIARMLSGDTRSDASLQHARELLAEREADRRKQ